MLSLLGRGSFGCVVRAYDPVQQQEVAVKIVKSRPGFLARAKAEAELVAFVNAADAEDRHHCVRLLDQARTDCFFAAGQVRTRKCVGFRFR